MHRGEIKKLFQFHFHQQFTKILKVYHLQDPCVFFDGMSFWNSWLLDLKVIVKNCLFEPFVFYLVDLLLVLSALSAWR